ncbi:hypothetical protein ATANTOWER_012119 [Ataeniobius toweri]|uniref:Uncharacterized protein n=1 Tax=Ataeniobius toweri TaxID=208326 RepID=A0ABU7BP91_9TELE|nr:hypothetical protein [Ataeniobius toweri]
MQARRGRSPICLPSLSHRSLLSLSPFSLRSFHQHRKEERKNLIEPFRSASPGFLSASGVGAEGGAGPSPGRGGAGDFKPRTQRHKSVYRLSGSVRRRRETTAAVQGGFTVGLRGSLFCCRGFGRPRRKTQTGWKPEPSGDEN